MVLFGPGFDKIVILGIISIPYNFRSCLFYYLALLALSEIASVRLCGLLFWYTGGFPARTTWPPCKVTTCPLLSLNLLPRGAGPLPGANLEAIAGGLGLITLPHFDFLAAAPPLPNKCNCCWIVWGLHFILFFKVLVIAFS